MIDQMALGHRFLLKEFGVRPTIGWQVDPFGHSSGNADLYAKMGLEAIFVARVDGRDLIERKKSKSLEMLWKPA
jgi:alpha-mannosidase